MAPPCMWNERAGLQGSLETWWSGGGDLIQVVWDQVESLAACLCLGTSHCCRVCPKNDAHAGIILGIGSGRSANGRWRHLSLAKPVPRKIPAHGFHFIVLCCFYTVLIFCALFLTPLWQNDRIKYCKTFVIVGSGNFLINCAFENVSKIRARHIGKFSLDQLPNI